MYNFIALLLTLFVGYNASSQCYYTLEMNDSYGDGWNGNTMDVLVNGTVALDDVTLAGGSQFTLTFIVNTGDDITTLWNGGGTWGSETSYRILDSDNTEVGTGAQTSITTAIVAACPTCPQPENLSVTTFTNNTISVDWNTGLSGETMWDVLYGEAGFDPSTEGTTWNISVASDTVIDGLNQLTTYEVYVRANCGGGDFSEWVGPISQQTAPNCPNPSGLTLVNSYLDSVEFSWTVNGAETMWNLQYGEPGFAIGSGTTVATTTNPDTLTGLPLNSTYEIYVQSDCGGIDTSEWIGPIAFSTQPPFMAWDTDCGPSFNDITTTGTALPNTGDDGEQNVTLPFNLLYQGTLYTEFTVGSNGAMVPGVNQNISFSNVQLNSANNGFYIFWDDLGPEEAGTDQGIYTETIGTAPNRQFIVQWNKRPLSADAPNDAFKFQMVIDEATHEIYYLYDDVESGNSSRNFGAEATIGVAGPNQDLQVSHNDADFLTDNSCAHFYYTYCPNPTNIVYSTIAPEEATISWNAGLAGETNWTIIYGEAGFDPTSAGTTVASTTNSVTIPGLTQLTEYDVYIYADCNPGTLQSEGGLTGNFTTLPFCSDPTGVTANMVLPDSIISSWNWTESSPAYPSTSFNVHYMPQGQPLYSGTTVNGNNDLADTTLDNTLIPGGIYELYVQAVCGADTSNFVGGVTFLAPLTNDSTCNAYALNVDGTVYNFNNTGATTQLNEASIEPAITGFQTTNGWGYAGMNFTTWFTFEAPASGEIRIDGSDASFAGKFAVYEATDCADFATFNFIGANDTDIDATSSWQSHPNFTLCGLTAGDTYYLVHASDDGNSWNTGNYSIKLSEVVTEAGTSSGVITVCAGDTVDVSSNLSNQDAGGVWSEAIQTLNFGDAPTLTTAGLAYATFDFEYRVVNGCSMDSIIQQVQILGPSSAGDDGTIDACKGQQINLYEGLSGNVDVGGTWHDVSGNPLPSGDIISGAIPGQYNYDYVTNNGVCANDTSTVTVDVDTCTFVGVEELELTNLSIFPNPTSEVVYISNNGSNEVFNFQILDLNGKVVASRENAINGTETTEVSLANVEKGIYMVRVFNANTERTFRVVKQ